MKKILFLFLVWPFLSLAAQSPTELTNILSAQSLSATGNITTQNLNPLTGIPTAGSFVRLSLNNHGTVTIAVSGTYTGALSAQYSIDGGTTWVTITNASFLTLQTTGVASATIASAANGAYTCNVAAFTDIRISRLAAGTGTAVVTIKAISGTQQIGINQALPVGTNSIGNIGTVSTLSQLIAAAALADSKANPSTSMIGSGQMNYNGATWDLQRGNQNTTTGDVGAKTASFAGATQTNFNARGAIITVLCGTVTGTTPTLAAQLQFSPNGGTTWINIGTASGTATATGNTIVFQVYPTNFTVAGEPPAALTTDATQTVQLNTVLPRTWRLNYTITGTTPSFTLTGVYVNYQL